MSAFDEAEASSSLTGRGGGTSVNRIVRPVAVRPSNAPDSTGSTGGGLYDAQVSSISQNLKDLAQLLPATRRQVDQVGTRMDTNELRSKMCDYTFYAAACNPSDGLLLSRCIRKTSLARCGEYSGSASRAIEQFAAPPAAGDLGNRDSGARRTQLKKFRMDFEKVRCRRYDSRIGWVQPCLRSISVINISCGS